jgi:hypothetical protein
LGSAGDRVPLDAILTEDAGFEERLDQTQDTLVPDSGSEPVHETGMRDFVEARFDVTLDHPLIGALSEVLDLGDGVMRPTLGAETVATRLEVRLEDRLEHQQQGCLGNPVSCGGDS